MREIWFRNHDGVIWQPVTWQGWVLTLAWFLSNGWILWQTGTTTLTTRDFLYSYLPFFFVSTFIFLIIARAKSHPED